MKPALSLAAAVALAACHSSRPAPVIDSFTADTNPLPSGATETLRWTVRNADTLTLTPGGDVTGKTSATSTPTTDVTYTLTAVNKDHPDGVKQTVKVTVAAAPAIVYFTAVPSQVLAGAPVKYSWSVTDAATVLLDNTPVTGTSVVRNATVTATHTLAVTGLAGATPPPPAQAVVRVVSAPAISAFTATPSSIPQGSTAVLSWTADGLGYSLDDGAHATDVGAQTRATVSPSATTTYTLTARGPAGTSVTRTQLVTVIPAGGTRTLSYADPGAVPGAMLALQQDASTTPGRLVLNVVTTQALQANALAFGLALDGRKVALDALSGSDVSPGFSVNTAALDPGTSPFAAKASLRTDGPLANVLTFGIARKPAGSGMLTGDAPLSPGTVVCTIRLVPAASAAPGPVFPLSADAANPDPSDAYKPYKVLLRGAAASSTKLAVGTLTMN